MSTKPNVLIIFSDQQRYDTIAAAGYPHMITPNLDKLASEGCIFTNAHTNNPVCMPARHDLLTGLTARHHGYFNNAEGSTIKDPRIPTIASVFSKNSYRTASIGKMHFFPVRAHHGYNEMIDMEEIPKNKADDQYAMYLRDNGLGEIQSLHGVRPLAYHTPQTSQMSLEHYETTWIEKTTKKWLDDNEDNPFFLFVGYIKPHPPWDIPEEYQGIYKDKEFPKTIARSREYPNSNETNGFYGDLDSEEKIRKAREAYFTACTMVDQSAGNIIEHLRETGKLDNTIVIYSSDHGEMLSDKGYYSKNIAYESSVRVPMIVRYPEKIKAGSSCDEFVDLFDIFPTCLDACNLEYPSESPYELYGSSLLDLENGKDRTFVYAHDGFLNENRWVMSKTKEYKYIYTYNNGTEELYDLKADPGETINLISSLKDSEIHKTMRQKAVEFEAEHGPEGAIENGDFIVIAGKLKHGCDNGKYHQWANEQFQNFRRLSGEEFGENFTKEVEKALSNPEHSACKLNEIFNNDEWKQMFKNGLAKYGTCENWETKFFK